MEESQDTTTKAKEANDPQKWNKIWKMKDEVKWRAKALSFIYDRIEQLLPKDVEVIDIGGGVGTLCKQLLDSGKITKATVWDHSIHACAECDKNGINTEVVDLLIGPNFEPKIDPNLVILGTEILEHLPEGPRKEVLTYASNLDFKAHYE